MKRLDMTDSQKILSCAREKPSAASIYHRGFREDTL